MGLKSRVHPALFCSPDVYVRAGVAITELFSEITTGMHNRRPFPAVKEALTAGKQ
jgi:hypothetical protein